MKTARFSFLLIALCLLVMSNACQPTLREFQSEKGSLFKISFSYPANWRWQPSPNARNTYAGIGAFEPYPVSDGASEKSRLITIEVWKVARPQTDMQEQIDSHLVGIDTLQHLELLSDFVLQIDEHNARWLTRKNTKPDFGNQPYLAEYIYLLAEDRYYTIILSIPESEAGGRFHTEFKAMIASIKFLP